MIKTAKRSKMAVGSDGLLKVDIRDLNGDVVDIGSYEFRIELYGKEIMKNKPFERELTDEGKYIISYDGDQRVNNMVVDGELYFVIDKYTLNPTHVYYSQYELYTTSDTGGNLQRACHDKLDFTIVYLDEPTNDESQEVNITTVAFKGEQGLRGEKGDQGDAFTYDDFTDEQIAVLQSPATTIAEEVAEAEAERVVFYNSMESKIDSKFDISDITQVAGSSSTSVMSQAGVANYLGYSFSVEGYIDNGGKYLTGSGRYCTDYLLINGDDDILFLAESNNQYVTALSFYDEDKAYISGVSNNQTTVAAQSISASEIPSNAVYIRASTTGSLLSSSFLYEGSMQSLLRKVRSEASSGAKAVQVAKKGVDVGVNIVKTTDTTADCYIKTDGTIESRTGWAITDYLPLDESQSSLVFYGALYQQGYHFYNSQFEQLSYGASDPTGSMTDVITSVISIPDGAKYLRTSFRDEIETAMIVYGSSAAALPSAHVTYTDTYSIDERISEIDSRVAEVVQETGSFATSVMSQKAVTDILGYAFNNDALISVTGKEESNSARKCTGYIPISCDCDISFLAESNNQYVNALSFYDEDKVYISGVSNNQTTISAQSISAANIPSNAAYIRVSTTTALLSSSFVSTNYSIVGAIIDNNTSANAKREELEVAINFSLSSKLDKMYGKNLFDKSTISEGVYLNSLGVQASNSDFYTSDYIAIEAGSTYTNSNFGVGGAYHIVYDENEVMLDKFNAESYTMPEGAAYTRLSGMLNLLDTAQLEIGSEATAYEEYTEYKTLSELQEQVSDIQSQTTNNLISTELSLSTKLDKVHGKNLLDPAMAVYHEWVSSSGAITAIEYGISRSGYISISEGETLVASIGTSNFYQCKAALYDEELNYISGSIVDMYTTPYITGTANSKYAVFTFRELPSSENQAQIEVGTEATTYEEYTDYASLLELQEQLYDDDVECVLPSRLYFVKDHESCIYFENVLRKNLQDAVSLYFDAGTNYNRQVTFNFDTAATDQTMVAQPIRSLKRGVAKSIAYNIVDPATNSTKSINALHIGDSFTDIGTWVSETKEIIEESGATYNLIGTCGGSSCKAEGLSGGTLSNTFLTSAAGVARKVTVTGVSEAPSTGYPGTTYTDANDASWSVRSSKIDENGDGYMVVTNYGATEDDFSNFPSAGTLTRVDTTSNEGDSQITYTAAEFCYHNPFINPSTGVLDMSNYLNSWDLETPDLVLLQFTWNDLGTWASDSSVSTVVDSFVTAVDHIRGELPNAKVILSIEPCGSINGNRDWNGKKYTVLKFAKMMIEQFEDNTAYSDWVYIAPSYAFVDLIYGYSSTTATPCERYNSITENSGGDGVHPDTGMYQIADCVSQIVHNVAF